MKSYYFILGRENKISQMELEAVLASFGFGFSPLNVSILSDQVLEIKLEASSSEIKKLIEVLGGTVKIFEKIAPADENVTNLLDNEAGDKKLIFGLSNYSKKSFDVFKLALAAKKTAKRSIRVIAGKENERLSSAQSFQYGMDGENVEYGIFDTGIGKLLAVQNIDVWSHHDYGKPKSDAVSGMLPPKLARMMVNIATGSSQTKAPLVIDPFCGSGNVLIEALSIGCDVIGSDVSEKAVCNTRANLEWLAANGKWSAEREDATKFDFGKIGQDFVVVTEPYLGRPRKAKLRIEEEKEAKEEIVQLYEKFLENLKLTAKKQQLKAAVVVFPLFELANGKQLSVFSECVDFILKIGYDISCSPMRYGRDYQVVKRELVILK